MVLLSQESASFYMLPRYELYDEFEIFISYFFRLVKFSLNYHSQPILSL